MLDEQFARFRERLSDEFPFYAYNCLWIRTKSDGIQSLDLNQAQEYVHARIEFQRLMTGKVRALILKGRQQGMSTYVQGRFIQKVTTHTGIRAFILTHEQDATENLFEMAERYYEMLPMWMQPSVGTSNAKELHFDILDSGYKIGTAGNKSVGRSGTIQLFHGSEVAYWTSAPSHAAGIMQSIADAPGTEIILESTANGVNNYFYEQWRLAERGLSEYTPIFVPWYWQAEYTKHVPADFKPTSEEIELQTQFRLTDGQLVWRRIKIVELTAEGESGEIKFKQEYPMTAAEAFQFTGGDVLIPPEVVMRCRHRKVVGFGPLIVGVDPSRGKGDRFTIIYRQGHKLYNPRSYKGNEVDFLAKRVAICRKILDTECPIAGKKPDMMFIDYGEGADLVERLLELGYEGRVRAINFGSEPFNKEKYSNKRNEMWGEMFTWMCDEHLPPQVPDTDEFQADVCASPYDIDANHRKCLKKKKEIRKLFGFSPDVGDAAGLTFSEPVGVIQPQDVIPRPLPVYNQRRRR